MAKRKTTTKKKTNKLLSSFNLGSKKAWIVLAFALVAGFLLYRTFALEPGVPYKGKISDTSLPEERQFTVTAKAGRFKVNVETTSQEMGVRLLQGTEVIAQDDTYEPVPLKRNRKRYAIDTNVAAGTYTIEVYLNKSVKQARAYTLTADWPTKTSTTPPEEEEPPTTPPPTGSIGKLVYSLSGGSGGTYVNEADLNGASVVGPAYVRLEHGTNSLQKVTFYVDGVLNRTDTTPAPFEMHPKPNFTGSPQNVSAVATLADGSTQTVTAAVNGGATTPPPAPNTPPATGITSPTSETVGGNVNFAASAQDSDGIAKVEFFVDNVLIATDTTSPFSTSWDSKSVKNGSHQLKVQAYDKKGAVGTASRGVTVSNDSPTPPPTPPPSGGFPTPSSTGVPAGTQLSPSGSFSTTRDGQVIENLEVTGTVFVKHNNVVIRKTKFNTCNGEAFVNHGTTGLLVEDVEIDGSKCTWNTNRSAGGVGQMTIRRLYAHDIPEGPQPWSGNSLIEDSYVLVNVSLLHIGAHHDGIQVEYGSNVTLRNNTVLVPVHGSTGSILIGSHSGHQNIVIDNNLLGTFGGYSIAAGCGNGSSNIVVRNNHILTVDYYPNGGAHGWLANASCATVSGNVWQDGLRAGQPI